jgi:SAM-dependent methyltransferase
MSTLEARRRIRRLIEQASHRARSAAAVMLAPTDADAVARSATPGITAERFARTLGPRELTVEGHQASAILYARLGPEKIAEIERRILDTPELRGYLAGSPTLAGRRYVTLAFGIWLAVPGLLEGTGLVGAQPPEDVHAMARGPLSAGGGLYEADMILSALESAGVRIDEVRDALDFGCSSGRVVRVLAAAYPEICWRGCDPNAGAIAWASAALPGIGFFRSGDEPPLELAGESLDLVCAISIWSHFEPGLGLRWFEEMHRLLRPGGHLVATTHGLASISHYVEHGLRSVGQSLEIADALYARGEWYAPEFGSSGDWGVVNPAWGTAFLSAEWMLTKLLPGWRVVEFAPGRNQENQDVYVLRRV